MPADALIRGWNAKLAAGRGLKPLRVATLCAFNANIDAVKKVSPLEWKRFLSALSKSEAETVERLSSGDYFPLGKVSTKAQATACIAWSIRRGEAAHVAAPPKIIFWLDRAFPNGVKRLGGQAGLMAENLCRLGCKSAVYPLLLSKKQAALFSRGVLYPDASCGRVRLVPVRGSRNSSETKENVVVEFGSDLSARPNRAIFSSGFKRRLCFPTPWAEQKLNELGGLLDACLFSGFHYLKRAAELPPLFAQLDALKQGRQKFSFHCEYVPFEDKRMEAAVLRGLCKRVKSLGLNEVELRELHRALFGSGFDHESVRQQAAAAERVYAELGLQRLHVHNKGYHLVVLGGKRDPRRCVLACLLASDEATFKASGSRKRAKISAYSLGKMREYSADASFLRNGFVERRGHFVVIAPASFVEKPVYTVGLGDIVSSTAFAAEL
ncbi:hypothetical protein COX86_01925 [Candidatus Micrarchaeota archaeon CG_4_10_14_0_2_um_filter_60_11]|nr:MAG: hypothetical protein AUJ16_03300 [Candidatus Micrarchaeota archaeon CG1_02_60_51]PIN96234.1 MAG: hypothetical protein COU39_02085 [Candidatus Micrarchaeota archaeon CG10_big_fil_rev_8_21_14_0_10_60_32]PIO02279.1 MAG: hypothetical protein COT58_01040 [Candidatus Micrarchaeota archaeon CG09_land_8_20_14_0_10_60_16]PIZ91028.1 MAG: hypothetical protein COX86_01925 [Candidatus Micrarchaeota archaeon CG_4_10_14_0_2_um_filter_60_11]